LALKWGDIDFRGASASICRSLEQTRVGLAFKDPKTPRARRVVALPRVTLEGLKRHRAIQAEERLRAGPVYEDQYLVCANPLGQPFKPDILSSVFRKLGRRAGLAPLRLHDLRHTHATQLQRQGVNAKIVSERLGHSSVSFTLDVYAHVLPDMQDDAARRIDASLSEAIARHDDS
jgi:integrase